MTVQDKAEEAVDDAIDRFEGLAGDREFIVDEATENAMAALDDEEWTGDEDQWDEVEGIAGRVYDRRMR